jgi:hypothetical protein
METTPFGTGTLRAPHMQGRGQILTCSPRNLVWTNSWDFPIKLVTGANLLITETPYPKWTDISIYIAHQPIRRLKGHRAGTVLSRVPYLHEPSLTDELHPHDRLVTRCRATQAVDKFSIQNRRPAKVPVPTTAFSVLGTNVICHPAAIPQECCHRESCLLISDGAEQTHLIIRDTR